MPALKWTGTGLLSLLGVKTGGRLPEWSDRPQVANVIDLWDLVLQDVTETEYLLENFSIPGASVAVINAVNLKVPAGQTWGLIDLGIASGGIATGALQFAIGWSPNTGTVGMLALANSPLMTPSPGQAACSIPMPSRNGRLWLPPGSTFMLAPQVNTVVAATAVTCWARFARASL